MMHAPVLALIAAEDKIIPRARAEAPVAAFAPGQVRTVARDGAQHNTASFAPGYLAAIRGFLAPATALPAGAMTGD